jgi:hypothetical protein
MAEDYKERESGEKGESKKDVTDFLASVRKQFDQDAAEEKDLRDEFETNIKFVGGEQWDSKVKQDRTNAGRPSLTFSRCHTFVQQVANEARQNKPQIKFIPTTDDDKDLAEIYEGLARHIQYDSDAQVAYETAVEYSAGGGFGYFGFITEYCDDKSFDQDLKIRPFVDPLSVYGILIPACLGQEPKHAFVVGAPMSKDEFKSAYPDAEANDLDWTAEGYGSWVGEDKIRVAEYWCVEEKQKKITKGNKERSVIERTVKFYKTNGVEILEETEWPGSTIPIIPVLGKLMWVSGQPKLYSVVTFQRDPQRLLNFYKTRIAETIALAPVGPYMVAEGQLEGHEAEWARINQSPLIAQYKPIAIGTSVIGKPERDTFEPPIASMSAAAAQEIDDMKATAGIFDASMGSESNEKSGIAIQRRQQQSNVTNMHYMDNLERGFKKGGMVIAEVLDPLYDTPRRIRILGEDETPKIVAINQPNQGGKEYKFGKAKFDVIVTMGRSFSTKRMESFDMMSSVIQSSPDILPLVGDIFFKNSDLAGADQLAERFKTMLPPQVQQAEQQKNGQQPDPQQLMAENAQLKGQMQQMGAELQDAQNPMKVKQLEIQDKSAQRQHDKEMASAQFEHDLQIKRMEMELKAHLDVMKHDSAEELAQHKSEQAAALEIYKVEAANLQKGLDRDAAAQQQEMAEDKSTAEAM